MGKYEGPAESEFGVPLQDWRFRSFGALPIWKSATQQVWKPVHGLRIDAPAPVGETAPIEGLPIFTIFYILADFVLVGLRNPSDKTLPKLYRI